MILTLFTKLQGVTLEHPDRRRSTFATRDARTNFRVLFIEIIDTITQHLQTRISDFVKVRFLDLLDSSKYREIPEDVSKGVF